MRTPCIAILIEMQTVFTALSYLSLHVSWAYEAQTNSGSMVNRHMKKFQYIEGASLHFKPQKYYFPIASMDRLGDHNDMEKGPSAYY